MNVSGPCANPGCSKESTKQCTKCRTVCYCSRPCQKLHYKSHKKDCARLANDYFTRREASRRQRQDHDLYMARQRRLDAIERGLIPPSPSTAMGAGRGFVQEFDDEEEREAFIGGGVSGQEGGSPSMRGDHVDDIIAVLRGRPARGNGGNEESNAEGYVIWVLGDCDDVEGEQAAGVEGEHMNTSGDSSRIEELE